MQPDSSLHMAANLSSPVETLSHGPFKCPEESQLTPVQLTWSQWPVSSVGCVPHQQAQHRGHMHV